MKKKPKHSKLGKQIIKAMEEVLRSEYTVYEYPDPPREVQHDIILTREMLGLTRDEFAVAFNFSKFSMRNWELGKRKPSGAALAYLKLIKADPWHAYKKLQEINSEKI